jgi:uncharacterized surface protein with fasciclin (FAS1) repeats
MRRFTLTELLLGSWLRSVRLSLSVIVAIGLASGSACGGGEPSEDAATGEMSPTEMRLDFPEETIPALLAADGRFETLLGLLKERSPAQLQRMAGATFNHTLFAPTDEAFAALPPNRLQSALDGEADVTRFFHQHVLVRILSSADLRTEVRSSDGFISVLAGTGFLKFSVDGGRLKVSPCELRGGGCRAPAGVEEATVIEADIEASNGLIHVIDGVLIPPSP